MDAMEGQEDKSWLEVLTLGCVGADCFTTRATDSKAKNFTSISSFNVLVSLPQRTRREKSEIGIEVGTP